MEERRKFLKRTGLILLTLAGPAAMSPGGARSENEKQSKPAMIIDVNRCTGCRSCVIGCKEQNRTPKGYFNTRIETVEHGRFPDAWQTYTPNLCHQCEDAPCVSACSSGATFHLTSGIVVVDWNRCTGDGACIEACPYDARFQDPQQGNKADKCDFCAGRLVKGLEPACVENCPSQARIFGDLANPQGEFATCLAEMKRVQPDIAGENSSRLLFIAARKVEV